MKRRVNWKQIKLLLLHPLLKKRICQMSKWKNDTTIKIMLKIWKLNRIKYKKRLHFWKRSIQTSMMNWKMLMLKTQILTTLTLVCWIRQIILWLIYLLPEINKKTWLLMKMKKKKPEMKQQLLSSIRMTLVSRKRLQRCNKVQNLMPINKQFSAYCKTFHIYA